MRSKIGAFVTLARRIRKHFGGIINAVTYGLSNSRVEGVNAKIRLINNRAHGHKSAPALIASIYLHSAASPSNSPQEGEKGYVCS